MPRSSRPPDPPDDADDLLICADVLGSFGVTAADVQSRRYGGESLGETDDLEAALADELAAGRDRTAVLRRTITTGERGLSCAARYARDALDRELTAVFDAIDWSLQCEHVAAALRPDDRLHLRATDYRGRTRETTIDYPSTPLGTDNLPAVLQAVNASLLAGTDARFVLLSEGIDRWRGALIDETALERLRERYGPRIRVAGNPLLPEHELESYVPDESAANPSTAPGSTTASGAEPWPDWADDRERDGDRRSEDEFSSLIEEAETDGESVGSVGPEESGSADAESPPTPAPEPAAPSSARNSSPGDPPTTTAATGDAESEFELRGSPRTSRIREEGADAETDAGGTGVDTGDTDTDTGERSQTELEEFDRASSEAGTGDTDAAGIGTGTPGVTTIDSTEIERTSTGTAETDTTTTGTTETDTTTTDEFGSLSGTSDTARVSNDSFGSDVEWETEDDRYRALGAALGAGGTVSVRGLLEDDEFLPALPAAEHSETRIEFSDEFDPAAVPRAKAAAEQSGFVWVESGSLETTRVSNS